MTVAVRLPVPEYEGELEYESTCVLVLEGVPAGVLGGVREGDGVLDGVVDGDPVPDGVGTNMPDSEFQLNATWDADNTPLCSRIVPTPSWLAAPLLNVPTIKSDDCAPPEYKTEIALVEKPLSAPST